MTETATDFCKMNCPINFKFNVYHFIFVHYKIFKNYKYEYTGACSSNRWENVGKIRKLELWADGKSDLGFISSLHLIFEWLLTGSAEIDQINHK